MNCIDQVEVEEIRAALERYDQMSAFFQATPVSPPLLEMRKAVSHAWLTYQHAKYGVLARKLPQLLRDARDAGCTTLDGGGMVAAQAAGSLELFTGVAPDRGRMTAHMADLVAGQREAAR